MNDSLEKLTSRIQKLGKVAVAFSGGVDSALLLEIAHRTLGDKALAISARLHSTPSRDASYQETFCSERNIKHIVVEINEFDIPGFADNPPERCYLCKKALMGKLVSIAHEHDACLIEGSNADDLNCWRPGLRALQELTIASPLAEAELHKADVRQLARDLNISCWNKPSSACLSSRFAFGEHIDREGLERVDKAETFLHNVGFSQVRVRVHRLEHGQTLARIELLPEETARLFENELYSTVAQHLSQLGFTFVTCDLKGFRSGSMEATLPGKTHVSHV